MRFSGVPAAWLVVLVSCVGGRVDAPEPARDFSRDTIVLPPLPPGTIVAPLTLDRESAVAALENEVPRKFGDIDQRIVLPDAARKSFAFEVTREPFKVTFAADTILLTSVIHYKGRGWLDPPIGPDIQGECGTKGEAPRARLRLRVVPRLSENWRIRVRTMVDTIVPYSITERDQCEVSFLQFDVTGKVLTGATAALRKLMPQVDRQLAMLDVRTPLEKIWVELQQPIRITDSLWLILQPSGVHLGRVRGSKETVGAQIGVTATPRILAGAKPVVASIPLPPLGPIQDAEGFSMLVEGNFAYDVMSGVLTEKLKGQKVRAAGGTLEVRKVTAFGVGGGRMAVGVDFTGTARGRIWLLGTPYFEAATGLISVPDLDFDATSAGMLVQGVAWLKGDAIREFIREQTKVPAGDVMKQIQEMAIKEMNRDLARGVKLEATIAASEPAGIMVRADGLILRARATGAARLELGPELFQKAVGSRQ
jgi:uncharacterized protein DUF4403